ncbi:MAG: hypothetical protein ACJ76T_16335 [Solirubrobacteraceae bacterium]
MSFFDEGDEPRGGGGGTATRPRRPAEPGGQRTPEEQSVFVRRVVAAVVGVVVVIVLIVLIQGCLSAQKEDDLKDYNSNVGKLVGQSDQVGDQLFKDLGRGGSNPQNLQAQVNALRGDAEQQVDAANKLDVPDDMKDAQRDFILALELRRDALTKIASELPAALSKQTSSSGPAIAQVTGQMQAFLASDVVYSLRVAPLVAKVLDDNGIGGQRIAQSRFLGDPLSWLDKQVVSQRLSGAGGTSTASGRAAPGVHGHSLDSVSVNGTDLSPDSANRIAASPPPTFTVNYTNSGENDEKGVQIQVSITGAGAPINLTKTADTSAGESGSAELALTTAPPTGQPVTIKATVKPVAGEKKVDNNTQSYPAVFTK